MLSAIMFPDELKLGDKHAYEILIESRRDYHKKLGLKFRFGVYSNPNSNNSDPDSQQAVIAFASSDEPLPEDFDEAKAMVMGNAGHSKKQGTADVGQVSLAAFNNGYVGPQFGIIKRSGNSPAPVPPPANRTGAAVALPRRTRALADLIVR